MSIGQIKWQSIVAKYAYPETWRSLWQVLNSVIPFFVLWYLAYFSLQVGYWLTLLITIPAAGFMVRMFIIFHDCCHGSFFETKLANDRMGFSSVRLCGLLTTVGSIRMPFTMPPPVTWIAAALAMYTP